mgnify:CR=1 FL=1
MSAFLGKKVTIEDKYGEEHVGVIKGVDKDLNCVILDDGIEIVCIPLDNVKIIRLMAKVKVTAPR